MSHNIQNLDVNLNYQVSIADITQHLFQVNLKINQPQVQQQLYLPVWIAGSYLVREFSKHLQNIQATQNGQPIVCQQLDKHQWQLQCDVQLPVEISYQVYAFDNSVRTAWLDNTRAFFNGTSMFLAVAGAENQPINLSISSIDQIANAKLATALKAVQIDDKGFGLYCGENYQQLIDCPVEISDFVSSSFTLAGVEHRIVVTGATENFDIHHLTEDMHKICAAEMQVWHGKQQQLPTKDYLFLLNAVANGYGGLEHRSSCAMICSRNELPVIGSVQVSQGYQTLLGLFSHEYFHSWNVKRLRPFKQIDYKAENYTELLWFFEGVTSYYDDLCLYRAGCIDEKEYLKLIEKTIGRVQQMPGRKLQSVAQASFDAWIKFYRVDENTANTTVSYYTKGSLLALCLDLTLRQQDNCSLDAVLQLLWAKHGDNAITYADVLTALQTISGKDYQKIMDSWVFGCDDLPIQRLLQKQGVQIKITPAAIEQQLGMQLQKTNTIIKVKTVLAGGHAQKAGVSAGDEILAINNWRMAKITELPMYVKQTSQASSKAQLLIARDGRLQQLELEVPTNLLNEKQATIELTDDNQAWQLAWQWQLLVENKLSIKQWLN